MDIYTLDFETFFSPGDYTLKKMTTEAYIRDPRFEPLMLGVRAPDGEKFWLGQEDIAHWLNGIDWSKAAILCHHGHFDGLILSHHYGVKPALWLDTLAMARLMVGNHLSVALDALARHFGLAGKSVPYDEFQGRHWKEIGWELRELLGAGCLHDVELTWELFKRLMAGFPSDELQIIDMTIRMFTEPQIVGDTALFDRVNQEEYFNKAALMEALGVTAKDLSSNDRFAHILNTLGVDIEFKDGANGPIPAFAKSDDFMRGLIEHPNEQVKALANARLEIKSTIDETRAGRLAAMSKRGPLCVYLNYCGAHTTRWSGGDSSNFQNFGRNSEIRRGLVAPEGHDFGIVDASQIECRLLNMVAGQWDVVDRFRRREDPYVHVASQFYGRQITKADKAERGTGKQLELSCGYGAGTLTIMSTAKAGTYGPPVIMTEQEALRARDIYRETHQAVVNLWRQGDDILTFMAGRSTSGAAKWGPVEVYAKDETGRGCMVLPGGPPMWYILEWDKDDRCWRRRTRRGWVKIWGGHLVENLIQYLARLHLSQVMLRLRRELGLRPLNTTHDELLLLLKRDLLQVETFDKVKSMMRAEPAWLPGVPLDCEGWIMPRYEKGD